MKKLLAGLLTTLFASQAGASLNFDFGTTWFFPKYDTNATGLGAQAYNLSAQGPTFTASWDMERSFAVGVHVERLSITDGFGDVGRFSVQQLSITKEVVKNATLGLRFGTFFQDINRWPFAYTGYAGVVTDVVASIAVLSGTVDKINGALKANVAGRFARDNERGNPWGTSSYDGYVLGLSVGIGI